MKKKYKNCKLIWKVFKIMHDTMRGPIWFIRWYKGNLVKNMKLYIAN